jgi:hypothetical protein
MEGFKRTNTHAMAGVSEANEVRRVNRHGLSDYIPRPIKEEVRQRCGFGCVVCGFAVYDYHHFAPPFAEAKRHDPDGITLLCGTCHGLENRGLLSNETIGKYNENPKCLQQGFSYGPFHIGDEQHPVVSLGYSTWIKTNTIVEVFGTPLLRIEPPEVVGRPFRLSGAFYDESGKEIFRIVQNEWQGPVSNWDIQTEGRRIIIRRAPRQVALQIRVDPPGNLVIEKLDMYYEGARIIGKEDRQITAIAPSGAIIHGTSEAGMALSATGIQLGHVTGIACEAGIVVSEDGVIFGRRCRAIC